MQCQDLDLSKSNQFSQLSQDLSEIKFSISKILLPNSHYLHNLNYIDKIENNNKQNQNIELKLKFYSALSNCKLKQKLARVSINKNNSTFKDSCILMIQKDSINLKVSFPTQQEYEIFGKIYIYYDNTLSGNETHIKSSKLLGTFRVNLLEWTKQLRKENGSNQNQNPQSASNIKMINLNLVKLQNQVFNQSVLAQSQVISNFKKSQVSETVQYSGLNPYLPEFKSSLNKNQQNTIDSFIEFKILQPQNVQNIFNSFHFDVMNNLAFKQKKLQIVNSIVNQKIPQISSILYLLPVRQSRFDNLPERQILKNISRARSQILFPSIAENKRSESIFKPAIIKQKKRIIKPFKQQIYNLLQQVKILKRGLQIQRKAITRNSSISRIKNIYCLLSPKKDFSSKLSVVPQNMQNSQKKQQQIGDFMIPLSSVLKKQPSDMRFSVNQNQLQNSLTFNAKYQKVFRIQKRLESYQKV